MASSILLIITASRDFHAEDQATVRGNRRQFLRRYSVQFYRKQVNTFPDSIIWEVNLSAVWNFPSSKRKSHLDKTATSELLSSRELGMSADRRPGGHPTESPNSYGNELLWWWLRHQGVFRVGRRVGKVGVRVQGNKNYVLFVVRESQCAEGNQIVTTWPLAAKPTPQTWRPAGGV